MYPESVQEQVLAKHGAFYRRHEKGYPALDVRQGRVDVSSIVDAPFGYGFDLDTTQFTPLDEWNVSIASGLIELANRSFCPPQPGSWAKSRVWPLQSSISNSRSPHGLVIGPAT